MNVEFTDPILVQEEHFEQLEQALGKVIPNEITKFFVEFNGSTPKVNNVLRDNPSVGIDQILDLKEVLEERKYIDGVGESVFPVALASGGNYVVIDLDENQSVFFWDHELSSLTKLADDVYGFMEKIEELEEDDLDGAQVISTWIDPEFLKEMQEEGNIKK